MKTPGSRLVYLLLGNLKWINLASDGRGAWLSKKKVDLDSIPAISAIKKPVIRF